MKNLKFTYGNSGFVMATTKSNAVKALNFIFETDEITKHDVLSPSDRVNPTNVEYKNLKFSEDLNEAIQEVTDREIAYKDEKAATPPAEWVRNKQGFISKFKNFEMSIFKSSAGLWNYRIKVDGLLIKVGSDRRGWTPLQALWGDNYREFNTK